MARDHAKIVLGAIIPDRRDLLLVGLQYLEPEHFRVPEQRNLFTMLERYYDVAADVLPRHTLSDLLERSGADTAKALLYEELYEEVAALEVAEHEFRYSIEALKDLRAAQLTGEAITTSFEIMERGIEIDREEVKGHNAAREYLYDELSRIDKLGNAEASPEGDIRLEADEIRQDYADRKAGRHEGGIRTGLSPVDNVTGGYQNGELILVCAYTGEGKSMLTTQTAWHASVALGKNVFFATSETIRPQVRRRIIARHSRLPQFGRPEGLNTRDLKNGTLAPEDEDVLNEVIDDLTNNPAYGRLYIAQVPRGGTLGFLEARLNRQQTNWNIDLVVMDYLMLLKPDRRRQTLREELNDIIKDAKVLAASFDHGRGIPFVSPWAMSQSAYKEALRTGDYSLANLAETSEAEKSADQILSLLRLPDQPNEVKCQFLKNRDGETPSAFVLETDYRCAYLGERSTTEMSSLLDDNGSRSTESASLEALL